MQCIHPRLLAGGPTLDRYLRVVQSSWSRTLLKAMAPSSLPAPFNGISATLTAPTLLPASHPPRALLPATPFAILILTNTKAAASLVGRSKGTQATPFRIANTTS